MEQPVIIDKWQFCPEKLCYKCGKDLKDEDYPEDVNMVTGCAFCKWSFVE